MGHLYSFGQTGPRSAVPCPFSVLLCKFEVVLCGTVVATRCNVGETKRNSDERMEQDGIRIADLSPVFPISHPGPVGGDAPRLKPAVRAGLH